MRKFFRNTRGAVTVFVTLLLIPAILISGTGVDLARIYAARSMTHDANQLAANAVLTNYDAMLQNLYGLYAVVIEDDNLTTMVDTYVRATLFGEEVTDAQLGEFRLFGGQESILASVNPSVPLSNVEILRRQIEEYAKWRVPVAIVKDIFERLEENEEFKQMEHNSAAMMQKLVVDEKLAIVLEKFREVRKAVDELAKGFDRDVRALYSAAGTLTEQIRFQLRVMLNVRKDYEKAFNNYEDDKLEDVEAHYDAISENIQACVNGGDICEGWIPATIDMSGNDVPGRWGTTIKIFSLGLYEIAEIEAPKLRKTYESELERLMTLCKEADAAKEELRIQIESLESQLNSGKCNPNLSQNMGEEIEKYKELLQYNFTELGLIMKNGTERNRGAQEFIDIMFNRLEGIEGYGESETVSGATLIDFAGLRDLSHREGFQVGLNCPRPLEPVKDRLTEAVNNIFSSFTFREFPKFQSYSSTHKACYDLLDNFELIDLKEEGEKLEKEEEEGKANIINAFSAVKQIWDDFKDNDASPGANGYIYLGEGFSPFSSQGGSQDDSFEFGSGDDGIRATLENAVGLVSKNNNIAAMMGNVVAKAGDRILLVGYANEMFSNWTSPKEGGTERLSLTGNPIDVMHNYYYRSELEYLIHGNIKASENLSKARNTILLFRFVANYASTYILSDVNGQIIACASAVSAVPFAGPALSFLVRPLFALAESVIDVSLLRNGQRVPLLKTQFNQWKFSLVGLTVESLKGLTKGAGSTKLTDLYYTDYLTIFLLTTNPDTLATRIGKLIELNITTVKESIVQNNPNTRDKDERLLAAAFIEPFRLSETCTTFTVTTETEVRFMFLSMPFAQQGIGGIIPPKTFAVTATDYRGY